MRPTPIISGEIPEMIKCSDQKCVKAGTQHRRKHHFVRALVP
ncbi:hypothetical protein QA640_38270 [Bradyrhizobium sp. CB82]|nr:hypothetical protein [Bradyrhizobium sp. CB82]WFU40028.1 hypothetical protein QA640_38270 [Bradyrhizobium sp. CB82]